MGCRILENFEDVYEYLTQKKCKDIALYDLRDNEKSAYTFIVSNPNPQANKKFASFVMDEFNLLDQPDGFSKGEWIIFDFGNVVIHSFVSQVREKYNLDKLWKSKKINLKKQK